MNKRQKKKWANWWRKDLYKWCRRHPKKAEEIFQKAKIFPSLEKLKEQEHEFN